MVFWEAISQSDFPYCNGRTKPREDPSAPPRASPTGEILRAEEIGLGAGVVVLDGPEGEGKCGEVVDERDGVAIGGQVDGADVGVTGFTGFYTDVRKLLGNVDRELGFRLLAAGGAEDAAEFPFLGAERAQEEALAPVAFAADDSEQRRAAAEGA
jgi:hypothetical protein